MNPYRTAVRQTEPDELDRRLRAGERIVLLDVREAFEREGCRIEVPPGSEDLHVPLHELPERLGEVEEALAAEPGRALVVYCHHGIRSQRAAAWIALRDGGRNRVENLAGGIDRWSLLIDPSVPRY